MSAIEWTDETWNPIVGCSRVSKGCENCYAERVAHRGMSPQHRGLTTLGAHGPRWNGTVRLVEDRLGLPLSWRKPRRIFVNSMSDLFHEALPFETIAAVFAVMEDCPQHTFQVLTKRPKRARDFCKWVSAMVEIEASKSAATGTESDVLQDALRDVAPGVYLNDGIGGDWPPPNVHLGVSVEDQAAADERIPVLLDTPAAVRWVSYEPALGPVDFAPLWCARHGSEHVRFDPPAQPWCIECDEEIGHAEWLDSDALAGRRLDWIVVGGESGPGARPFDLAWARSTVEQCREAGVACFVKQLGARPLEYVPPSGAPDDDGDMRPLALLDRKGGDPAEWPADLRVREMPEVRS